MPVRVTLEIEDLRARWTAACRILAEGCRTAVQKAVEEAAAEARASHPYKDHSGNLTRSIRGRLDSFDRFGAQGSFLAEAKYASFVENGTRPHPIWPKEGHGFTGPLQEGQSRRAKSDIGTHRVALRWTDEGGAVHFARMVNHPGGKPFPFAGPALLKMERVIEREIGIAVAAAGESLER